MSTLKIDQLKILHGEWSLVIENMKLAPGEIHFIKGASGSGKTTFVRSLLGLENEVELQGVLWGNQSLSAVPLKKRNWGVCLHLDFFLESLRVDEVIGMIFKARGLGSKLGPNLDKILEPILKYWELDQQKKQKIQSLSSGEKLRVQLICALESGSEFLILDEPSRSLDLSLRKKFRQRLKEIIDSQNISCLFVTHFEEDIEDFRDFSEHFVWEIDTQKRRLVKVQG